ncbi:hypothetical protein ACFXTH_024258 [Malus domestica]
MTCRRHQTAVHAGVHGRDMRRSVAGDRCAVGALPLESGGQGLGLSQEAGSITGGHAGLEGKLLGVGRSRLAEHADAVSVAGKLANLSSFLFPWPLPTPPITHPLLKTISPVNLRPPSSSLPASLSALPAPSPGVSSTLASMRTKSYWGFGLAGAESSKCAMRAGGFKRELKILEL